MLLIDWIFVGVFIVMMLIVLISCGLSKEYEPKMPATKPSQDTQRSLRTYGTCPKLQIKIPTVSSSSEQKHVNQTLKVVIAGNALTGKTTLLKKFLTNKFNESEKPTTGTHLFCKKIEVDSNVIEMQVWDTDGQERFQKYGDSTSSYFKDSNVAILTYDVTNRESFEDIEKHWISNVVEGFNDSLPPIILVATKCDLESKGAVTLEEGKAKVKKIEEKTKHTTKVTLVETSAKTGANVKEVFKEAAKAGFWHNYKNSSSPLSKATSQTQVSDAAKPSVSRATQPPSLPLINK